MTKRELGESYFAAGYNCAQSVVLAFKDELNINEETLKKISSAFGGGMGRMREVCGAVSGMLMVLGMLKGYSDPKDVKYKGEYYALIQSLAGEFKEKNGSIICRELLGLSEKSSAPTPEARTPEYYKKRPCKLLVGDACEILEEYLQNASSLSDK